MRKVNYTNQFKKDVKLASKRDYDITHLYTIMKALENEEVLNAKCKEHKLLGNYKGYLECHVEPDWLLIYKIDGQNLYFARTGTHSDLF
ncbi:MAG: type II toxin-antitoxin system YafQ family toxin [Clostridia bacterium]|nr:type II toxin-antitoxin system YafQ family toxin [Clostridia bacterium]MDD4047928.1 type II toxin-antitoxin system YafQ family toxin [Clostridia bacterium]